MDYKDKVVNAEVILPDGYSIGGSGLPSQSFKLYTEDTATIKLSGNGEKATPLKGVVVVAEDENNALQAGDNGLAVKVSPAANNLLELKQGALYVTAPEINIPISPKEGNALTNLTSEGEEGLYVAPTKVQGWIYDPAPGVAAIPGMFGFGSDLVGIDTVYFNNKAEFLTWVQNTRSGRYLVSQIYGSEPIINSNVTFSGILEVIPTSSVGVGYEENLPNVWKNLIFYGVNYGDIWYTRFITQPNRLDGWRCLDKTTDIINLQNSLNSKAPLYNPNFTGTPQSPTPSDSAMGTQIANVEFVKKQISDNAYTLSAGTVTVLDSGSQPTIEITGQSPSQVLNLGIPKAPDGQTIKSVNAVVKEIDSAQQVTLTFTMTDDSSQQASFNIPFSPHPTMKLSATSGNFSFNYSDTPSAEKNAAAPSAKNAAGRSGSSIYLKTTVDLNRAPAGSTDVMVDVRLTEIPCTEDGTYLDYDIYAEYPSVVGSGQPTVAVWLILPTVPTHTIDPKTKRITKLLRGDGLSGLNGIIPIAGADEQVHEFKYFLQYSYLNN